MDMPTPDEVPGDLKLAGDIVNSAQDLIDKVSGFYLTRLGVSSFSYRT